MDIKMQYLLKKNRAALQDVDTDDILDDIISSGTLTDEDVQLIKNKVIYAHTSLSSFVKLTFNS